MARISIASAKAKARRLQNRVRDIIRAMFPQLEPGDVESTPMGVNGEDVKLSPAARRLFKYQIECKQKGKSALHTDFKQCAGHGPHEPLMVVGLDRGETLAVVRLDHFMALVDRAGKYGDEEAAERGGPSGLPDRPDPEFT